MNTWQLSDEINRLAITNGNIKIPRLSYFRLVFPNVGEVQIDLEYLCVKGDIKVMEMFSGKGLLRVESPMRLDCMCYFEGSLREEVLSNLLTAVEMAKMAK